MKKRFNIFFKRLRTILLFRQEWAIAGFYLFFATIFLFKKT